MTLFIIIITVICTLIIEHVGKGMIEMIKEDMTLKLERKIREMMREES